MRSTGVPTAAWALSTKPIAIGAPTLGPNPPEVTIPILPPSLADDLRPFSRGRAAVRPYADAQPARPVRQRALNPRRAGKAALGAAALLNRPGKRRFDRIHALVELMPVEAEAGLESERIARAKPDRRDAGLAQEQAGEALRVFRAKRNLVAVFARVAGARDESLDSSDPRRLRAHERHGLEALSGRKPRQGRGGERALKRDQRSLRPFRQPDPRGQIARA